MKPTLKIQPLALAMLTAMLVLAGCKDASSPAGKPPADEVSTALDAGAKAEKPDPLLVSVAADFGADIKVAPAGARSVSDTLRVAGKVDFDEYRVSRIGATVTGRVIEINVRLGQQVKVGDALAKVYFAVGKAELDEADKGVVAQTVEALAAKADGIVLLSGFHDPSGDPARNAELAKQRDHLEDVPEGMVRETCLRCGWVQYQPADTLDERMEAAGLGKDDAPTLTLVEGGGRSDVGEVFVFEGEGE